VDTWPRLFYVARLGHLYSVSIGAYIEEISEEIGEAELYEV
jgi:hypothetical protein